MKKRMFVYMATIFAALLIQVTAKAQDSTSLGHGIKKAAKSTGHAISKGAKAVGHKTAEVASKGKAGMVDKKYDGKKGPDGQTIYIDKNSKYYWIDKKGHRQFVQESSLH